MDLSNIYLIILLLFGLGLVGGLFWLLTKFIKISNEIKNKNEVISNYERIINDFNSASVQEKESDREKEELIFLQKTTILNQKAELDAQNRALQKWQDKAERVESQKKSSEVRLGQMAENFIPFINCYPYDHKRFRFLANPCDGIQFNDDAVIFVEFKTGGARLSSSQKSIRDLVGQGKVRFETFRVDESGTHLKIESNMEDITK